MLQLLDALLCVRQFFLRHFPKIFITLLFQHCKAVFHILFRLLILLICLYDGSQIRLLLHQSGKTLCILSHIRIPQHQHQFFVMDQYIIQFIKHNLLSPIITAF